MCLLSQRATWYAQQPTIKWATSIAVLRMWDNRTMPPELLVSLVIGDRVSPSSGEPAGSRSGESIPDCPSRRFGSPRLPKIGLVNRQADPGGPSIPAPAGSRVPAPGAIFSFERDRAIRLEGGEFADNDKARRLLSDGTYEPLPKSRKPVRGPREVLPRSGRIRPGRRADHRPLRPLTSLEADE